MTTIIDDQGRLFGKVNLIDAAIGLLLFVLLPVAYAAFLLFRTPTPRITAVESVPWSNVEERVAGGTPLLGKLKVRGTGLRPLLRASIGDHPAIGFIFENPTSADVLHGEVPAGTHDLILYDGGQVVARAAGAVTIPPRPSPTATRILVVGTLIDLDEAAARALHVGARFPATGDTQAEIVALGDPQPAFHLVKVGDGHVEVPVEGRWQRPAAMMLRCELAPEECRIGRTPLAGAPNVPTPVPGSSGGLKLLIDALLPNTAPHAAEARVRFIAHPELLDLVKVGDRDAAGSPLDERGASIVALGRRESVQGETSVELSPEATGVSTGMRAPDRLAALDAVVQLGLDQSRSGWRYRAQPIKVGAHFTFVTGRYVMRGLVLSLTFPRAARAGAADRGDRGR